jgi:hypothetical protein
MVARETSILPTILERAAPIGDDAALRALTAGGYSMRVRHRLFESTFKSWEALCDEAAAFASTLGHERLISIAVSQADTGGKGVVFVWYWE